MFGRFHSFVIPHLLAHVNYFFEKIVLDFCCRRWYKRTMLPMHYEFRAHVDFLDLLQEVNPSSDDYGKIAARIRKLKYVQDVWIDHMCIIVLGLETNSATVAERRIHCLLGQVERLIRRYRPKR